VNHKALYKSKTRRGGGGLPAGIGLLLLGAGGVCGQEALRMATAGDAATAAQKQADSAIGYYNLLLGPTAWNFSSGLRMEYNDNIRLAQNDPEDDYILQPHLNAQMNWPVTQNNSLDFSLGAGYSEYLQHSDLSQFYLTPGSGYAFNFYVGDFVINLHDRISITQSGYENPGVSGNNQNLESLQNSVGTKVEWALNKATAAFGYDHVNFVAVSGNQSQPNSASDNFFANAGARLEPELTIGLEEGGSLINYSQTPSTNAIVQPNMAQWSSGVFGNYKISEYLSARLDAGYTAVDSDRTTTNQVTSGQSGLYASLSLTHVVNQWVHYTLSAGRSTDAASFGQVQTYYYVRLSPGWTFLEKYTLSTPFTWQQGNSVVGSRTAGNSDYEQITAGLTVTRRLTKKLTGGFNYQYIKESSRQSGLNYADDLISLNFDYKF
jgi:hypothetical protein